MFIQMYLACFYSIHFSKLQQWFQTEYHKFINDFITVLVNVIIQSSVSNEIIYERDSTNSRKEFCCDLWSWICQICRICQEPKFVCHISTYFYVCSSANSLTLISRTRLILKAGCSRRLFRTYWSHLTQF